MPFLPFIPFEDCVEIVMGFEQQSVPWNLTFGVQSNDPLTSTIRQDIWDVFDAWWTNDLRAQVSTNCDLLSIKLTDLTTQFSPTILDAPTGTAAGALTGSVLPAQVAMVTSLYTLKRGRSYRGRSYLGGRVFADQDTVTVWGATRIAAVDAAYTSLLVDLNGVNCNLAVLSRQVNSVRRTVGEATIVSSIVTKAPIATIQNRLGA